MKRVLAALLVITISLCGFVSVSKADWSRPRVGQEFYWQLSGTFRYDPANLGTSFPYYYADLDGVDQARVFLPLQYAARAPICYISVGTSENWRPDFNQFRAADMGRSNGWPGEKWLDIRSANVRTIMRNRIERTCANALGVEFDNQDGYSNNTGFPLTARDQFDYNVWLANTAHAVNKTAVLKNDVDQVSSLEPYYDMALNEECAQYRECGVYTAFTAHNKLVVQVEYRNRVNATYCADSLRNLRMLYFADLDLTGQWLRCPTQPEFRPGAPVLPPRDTTPPPDGGTPPANTPPVHAPPVVRPPLVSLPTLPAPTPSAPVPAPLPTEPATGGGGTPRNPERPVSVGVVKGRAKQKLHNQIAKCRLKTKRVVEVRCIKRVRRIAHIS